MGLRVVRRDWAAGIALLVLLGRAATAQAGGKSEATVLFEAGRAAAKSGDFKLACKKFEASYALDPGVGTELNLANCREQLGQVEEAQRLFEDAAERSSDDPARERFARSRAEALSARTGHSTRATRRPINIAELVVGPRLSLLDHDWRTQTEVGPTIAVRGGVLLGRLGVVLQFDYAPIAFDLLGTLPDASNPEIAGRRWRALVMFAYERRLQSGLFFAARAGIGIDRISATYTSGSTSTEIPHDTGIALGAAAAVWHPFGPVQIGAELALPLAHHAATYQTYDSFKYTALDAELLLGVRVRR